MDLERLARTRLIGALVLGAAGQAFADVPARAAPNVALGRTVYQTRCAVCHGEKGDGKGPAATGLNPAPRDFTAGQYRVRPTPPGQPVTGADLYRSISNGMAGTAMVPWNGLLSEERWALVDYLQSLSPRFAGPEPKSILVPPAPPPSDEAATRGVRCSCGSPVPGAMAIKGAGTASRPSG